MSMPHPRPIAASRTHLAEAGMDYVSHFGRAARIGGRLIVAGGACLVHGLVPGLFTTRATRTIIQLNDEVAASHKPSSDRVWLEFEI